MRPAKVMSFRFGSPRKVAIVLSVLLALILFNVLYYEDLTTKLSVGSYFKITKNRFVQDYANWQKYRAAVRLAESYAFNFDDNSADNVTGADHYVVPNIVHYFRYETRSFSFVDYICLRSAYVNQRPDYIFIHTDVTGGFVGKYWRWIKQESDLEARIVIVPSEVPTEVFGHKFRDVWRLYHGSDVARLQALKRYGGIFLDNDMYVINNLDKYRKYEITVSWPNNGTIGNMFIMTNRNARFLSKWIDNYRDFKPDIWYYNAGDHPAEMLATEPGLAHREMKRLGTKFVMRELYQEKFWDSDFSINYDAVHLLIRHRKYLDMYFKDYRYFNERNVMHYPFTFGGMARNVLKSVPFRIRRNHSNHF